MCQKFHIKGFRSTFNATGHNALSQIIIFPATALKYIQPVGQLADKSRPFSILFLEFQTSGPSGLSTPNALCLAEMARSRDLGDASTSPPTSMRRRCRVALIRRAWAHSSRSRATWDLAVSSSRARICTLHTEVLKAHNAVQTDLSDQTRGKVSFSKAFRTNLS